MGLIKSTAKSVVMLAAGLVMYGAMKRTAPGQDKHQRALTESVEKIVDYIYQDKIEFPEESRKLARLMSDDIIPKAVNKIINGKIDLSDYHVVNLVTATDDEGNEHLLSIGVLGMVFPVDHDYILHSTQEVINEEDGQEEEP